MSMRQTIAAISQMESDGIIGQYAIGGVVASFLYIDVTFTTDLDIIVSSDHGGKSSLANEGFFEGRKKGIVVHGWPVRFLPATDSMDQAGLQRAVVRDLPIDHTTSVRVRVLGAEHLMAKALAVGRPKDHVMLTQLIQAGRYDAQYFRDVLDQHGLSRKWDAFCEKFEVTDSVHRTEAIRADANTYPDISDILDRKALGRVDLHSRSFAEKLDALDALRDRAGPLHAIRAVGPADW